MKKLAIVMSMVCFIAVLFVAYAPEIHTPTEERNSIRIDIETQKVFSAQWDDAVNSHDLDRLIALYTEDAVRLPPGGAAVESKEEIRASFQSYFDTYETEVYNSVDDARVSGDLAFARGIFTETLTPKAGGESTLKSGFWLTILGRQTDGSWKVLCDIWNRHQAGVPLGQDPKR